MNETTVLRAALTDRELVALVRAVGLEPGPLSPVADALAAGGAGGDLSADVRAALLESGWLQAEPGGPSHLGRIALTCLARPQTRIGVVIGSSTWVASTISVAAGDLSTTEPMLSMGRGEGEWFLMYPQPQTQLVTMLQDHFDLPLVPVAPAFEASLSAPEYAALMAVFDRRLSATLGAALDRGYDVDDAITPAEAVQLLAEGRTSSNLAWHAALTTLLQERVDLRHDETSLAAAFTGLERRGLVGRLEDGRFLPTGALLALVDQLVPLMRFAGVRVDHQLDTATVETTQIVVRHGTGAILFEEVLPNGHVLVRSVSSTELADLLLGVRFRGGVRPAPASFCGRCGARLQVGDRFCATCGTPTANPGGRR
jgi:hypothetical protein